MHNRKDWAESIAEKWLRCQGYTDIRFVSDTNSQPPDFVIDKRVAVEVTRLTDEFKTLEEKRQAVFGTINRVLGEFEICSLGNRVYVWCELIGGISERKEWPEKRTIEKQVRRAVEEYMTESKDVLEQEGRLWTCVKELDCGMRIKFRPSKGKFHLEDVSPTDRSHIVNPIDEINQSVKEKRDAIDKKEGRIKKYSEWWLVLTDDNAHVFGFWNDEFHQQEVRNGLKDIDTEPWSRIYVIREPVSDLHIRLK